MNDGFKNDGDLRFTPDTKLIKLFLKWLHGFDKQHATNWGHLYRKDPEAAMCEATFWGILSDCGIEVEPNANLKEASKAPDFRCSKDGYEFFFEATCIKIDTAIAKTGLPHPTTPGSRHYSLLNGAICFECIQKTKQCASVDAPCVLGIGTFHSHASVSCVTKTAMEWLLTGEPSIGLNFDPNRGQIVGEPYSLTRLQCASFFRSLNSVDVISEARTPISAVLVSGFSSPPSIYGVGRSGFAARWDGFPTLLGG